jgi:tetratricopeptide (TPR) repeat protein
MEKKTLLMITHTLHLHNIGTIYSNQGAYDKALEYYEKCLDMEKKTLHENHPHIATSLSNIGSVCSNKIEYDKALNYCLLCLHIQMSILPSDHPQIATSLNNIGNMYSNKGVYDEALNYYEKSLEMRRKTLYLVIIHRLQLYLMI